MGTTNETSKQQRYSKIFIRDEMYKPDDAVIIKNEQGTEEVAMITKIFGFKDETFFSIRKYPFARNLKRLFKNHGEDYDKSNEVVQDLSKCDNIKVNQVNKKCVIAFLCPDDDVYFITENHLDPNDNYSCRFAVKGDQLFPVVNNVLTEKSLNSPTTKIDSGNNKQKNNIGIENTPVTNGQNAIEIYFEKELSPPAQRNSVKRDLNKSFGNSPTTGNKSILNYSIISLSDDETKDKLVVKLKVSKKRNGQTSHNVVASPPKQRKSNRNISRKSYADYISPIKISPTKRQYPGSRRESEDDDSSQNIASRNNTPRKQPRSENSTPTKREIRGTPVRRSLRLTSVQSDNSPKSVRSARKNVSYAENDLGVSRIGTNLDDSFRRNILKVNLAKTNTKDNKTVCLIDTDDESDEIETDDEIDTDDESDDMKNYNKKKTNLDDSFRRNILKVNLAKTNTKDNKTVCLIDTDDESDEIETDDEIDTDDESDDMKNYNKKKVNLDDSLKTKIVRIHLENLNLSNESCEEDDTNSYSESDTNSKVKSVSRKPKSVKKIQKQLDTPKSNKKSYSTSTPTKTPKSIKATPKTTKVTTPKTPKNRAKLIREGVVTPSMHERSTKIKGDSTPLMKARSQLHVSYVPESLPCREKEYLDIYNFVEGKLLDGCGSCMYISGVPGTGKTATVTSVIRHLQENRKIPKFTFVNVNGMRLSEPRQSYVEILKQLTGKSLSWEQAQNTLEEMFIKQKKMTPIVMLIDELDILCTKRQDVVYNLLDWPTKAKNQLIVITIANTMDLPERLLMNRVTSRLGLTRLTFHAYTYKQLQEIVTKRLCGTDSFNPDAVQFVARKVASVSGDARRALDICRRAAEIAETKGKEQLVNMCDVNEALSAMITQPKVLAIKTCSRLEQLILHSIVAEVERTGVEETTFFDVYKMLITCAGIEGFKMVSPTLAQSAVARLSACRLILADQKYNNIYQKIILNVSVDDVYYALKRN